MKKTRIWVGVGASVLASSLSGATGAVPLAPLTSSPHPSTHPSADHKSQNAIAAGVRSFTQAAPVWRVAAEGGEGGEAGIDPNAADKDPVQWSVALGIIAAHYQAGLVAYADGEMDAGAQMFAHGLGEVYYGMEDAFKRRGLASLGSAMQALVEAATAKAATSDIEAKVAALMTMIGDARGKGPTGADLPINRARAAAELVDRAAMQFMTTRGQTDFEPYLDGLGFALAAKAEVREIAPALSGEHSSAMTALHDALDFAAKAFPGAKRPADDVVDGGQFLAAASKAKFALAGAK